MQSVIIIGAGQAGLQSAESLRKAGFTGELHLIDQDHQAVFQRPPLSKAYLSGELELARLRIKAEQFFEQQRIQFINDQTVMRIDRSEQRVILADQRALSYDRLILATGARPRQLPSLDMLGRRVHVIRSLQDADRLKSTFASATRYAVLGGGFLGLECAATFRKAGKSVHVLERESRILNRVLSTTVSERLAEIHHAHGVKIMTDTSVTSVSVGDQGECQFQLSDNSQLVVDEILVAIGVIANEELAADCGLTTDNGIVTDANGQTSDPHIFAVGDCARFFHTFYQRPVRLESVDNAFEQSRSIARFMLTGQPVSHKVPWFWSDQYNHKLLIAGVSATPTAHHSKPTVHEGLCVGVFEGGRLSAVECLDAQKEFAYFRKLLNNKDLIDLSQFLAPLNP